MADAFDPDSVPGNGNRDEDDLGVAAIGGLQPSMPPTDSVSAPVSGGSAVPDLRGLLGILLAGIVLALVVRPRGRRLIR